MVKNSNPAPRTAPTYEMPFRPALNPDVGYVHPRIRLADAGDVRQIGHLLVVAGPSGAGKSTFIQLLAAGDLPEEVNALFPGYRRDWPLVGCGSEVNPELETKKFATETSIDGLVLHYDFLRVEKGNLAGFDQDKKLQELFACAAEITVVTIKLAADSLANQLVVRHARFLGEARARDPQASWIAGLWRFSRLQSRLWAASASHRLRRGLAPLLSIKLKRLKPMVRLTGKLDELEQSKFVTKMTKARELGWLERLYEDWDEFLKATSQARNIRTVAVTQPPAGARSLLWRLSDPWGARTVVSGGDHPNKAS